MTSIGSGIGEALKRQKVARLDEEAAELRRRAGNQSSETRRSELLARAQQKTTEAARLRSC